ncbi:MAG: adenosylcobinamide-GDP ribazoletransferase [Bryobacteraceae bacterium]
MRALLAAIAFLTRLPVGRIAAFNAEDVSHSAGWFPVVGLLLGAIYALAAFLLKGHLPLAIVAVLLVILDALATGALHFDGLADTADGFGGGKNREDILRIMRDHAIGSYGGVAIVTLVALKVAAYAALLKQSVWIAALILTPALGRWSILLLTAALPYARTSASVVEGMGKRSLLWGTLTIAAGLAATVSIRSCLATAGVAIVTAAFGLYCRRRIGGITGDTLGANLQLCECVALLLFIWA